VLEKVRHQRIITHPISSDERIPQNDNPKDAGRLIQGDIGAPQAEAVRPKRVIEFATPVADFSVWSQTQ
jgi:hypothetical protein